MITPNDQTPLPCARIPSGSPPTHSGHPVVHNVTSSPSFWTLTGSRKARSSEAKLGRAYTMLRVRLFLILELGLHSLTGKHIFRNLLRNHILHWSSLCSRLWLLCSGQGSFSDWDTCSHLAGWPYTCWLRECGRNPCRQTKLVGGDDKVQEAAG